MNQTKGLSLIGVVIALGILSTSVLIMARLLVGRHDVVGLGRERLVAVALAREGLELTRAIRDSNWLATQPTAWNAVLCDGNGDYIIDAVGVRDQAPLNRSTNAELYQETSGEWVHQAANNNQPTGYSRQVHVDCSAASADPEVITVTSRVTWKSREQDHEVELKEELFNWFPVGSPPPAGL